VGVDEQQTRRFARGHRPEDTGSKDPCVLRHFHGECAVKIAIMQWWRL
jgi:hypothetical protein